MNTSVKLSHYQMNWISKVTGITDRQNAIQYFAELMMKERIDPSRMPVYVTEMMKKEEKKK